MQLTNAEIQRINAFQMKGVRRILGIPPTHIDRQWTNARVWEKAKNDTKNRILRFSEMLEKRKMSLLGHVIRADIGDPMREVV